MPETTGFRWFRGIVLTLMSLGVLVPLYVMVTTSLKPLVDVSDTFRWLPTHLTAGPYRDIWTTIPLARYFLNSLIVSTASTVLSVAIAVFAAYAVSRFAFRGRRAFSTTVLATQMFPGILFLLPLFLIYTKIQYSTGIHLDGTYLGLILTYLTFSLPFSIWMLVGFFNSIPRDLEQAAMVDGNGPVGALIRIILPVARPGIIAVAVFAFMTSWSEVLFASVLTSNNTTTLAIGLQSYAGQSNVYYNQLMAASIVVSIPVLVGFLAVQRYLVRGLTAGAVK
jgi:multiple sugar transport system permease protein